MNLRQLVPVCCLLIGGCGEGGGQATDVAADGTGRWYMQAQVERGRIVFSEHCASCHGDEAQGLASDWRRRLDDGSFPPPPLDGSAHAWHHPRSVLLMVINNGGSELGGRMPPFGQVLTDDEKLAAIAYFQDFWSDDTYFNWQAMGGVDD